MTLQKMIMLSVNVRSADLKQANIALSDWIERSNKCFKLPTGIRSASSRRY